MNFYIRTGLLASALFVATLGTTFAAQVSIGIQIGQPPPPPRVVYVTPARPGPDYIFVTGYWFPSGKQYKWRDGYWIRPPYSGAVWVMPRYAEGRYFEGHWAAPPRNAVGVGKPGNGRGRGRGQNR